MHTMHQFEFTFRRIGGRKILTGTRFAAERTQESMDASLKEAIADYFARGYELIATRWL